MYASLASVVFLAVGVLSSDDLGCDLRAIPIQPHVDEHALAGRWFEMRWFNSDRWNPNDTYRDYVVDLFLDPHVPGFNEKGYYEETFTDPFNCRSNIEKKRKRLSNGVYEVPLGSGAFPNARKYVVETDYKHYLIEFQCLTFSGDTCTRAEAILWTRNQKYTKDDLYTVYHRYLEVLQSRISCIDPDVYLDTVQTENEGGCYPDLPEHGYPGNKYPGYGYPGYDEEYKAYKEIRDQRLAKLQAETATEVAATDKYAAVKATQEVLRQKLKLEIEIIKKAVPYPLFGKK